MNPLKSLSTSLKIFFILIGGVCAVALVNFTISTTAQSSQAKRQLDDRVPAHLPIKIKIKKEKEEGFQDLNNEHWPRDFQVEVKNTGDRPIYALSLVWMLADVKAPDGNPYGSTFKYGRSDFITVPGETPKPEDDPIEPGETYIFKLSNPSIGGLENFAKNKDFRSLKSVRVFFHYLCFGDGTGWESPDGRSFERKKSVAFFRQTKEIRVTASHKRDNENLCCHSDFPSCRSALGRQIFCPEALPRRP